MPANKKKIASSNIFNEQKFLVVFPSALGDSVLCSTVIDKIGFATKNQKNIFVATLPYVVNLFNEVKDIAMAFSYEEFPELLWETIFDWVIDLSGLEYYKLLGDKLQSRQIIYRKFNKWEEIIVQNRTEKYKVIDSLFNLSKNSNLLGHLPVWLEESASLVAHALGDDPLDWLNGKTRPSIKLKNETILEKQNAANEIIFLPCGDWEAKRWPEEYWIDLSSLLKKEGFDIILVLGPKEQKKYRQLKKVVNQCYISTNLIELITIISFRKLIISNDCGPLHIGAAIGMPCISIFGPTNPYKWFWYHNQYQLFVQTEESYQRSSDIGWNVNREKVWKYWPSENQVYEKAMAVLSKAD